MATITGYNGMNHIKRTIDSLDLTYMTNFHDETYMGVDDDNVPKRIVTLEFVVPEPKEKKQEVPVYSINGPSTEIIKRPCTAIELHRDSARATSEEQCTISASGGFEYDPDLNDVVRKSPPSLTVTVTGDKSCHILSQSVLSVLSELNKVAGT